MRTNIMILLCVGFMLLIAGCTEQDMAKNFGGTANIEIANCQKVVNATWKEDNLWLLTRPMREDEKPEKLTLSESSSFGLLEGSVIINEKCDKQ